MTRLSRPRGKFVRTSNSDVHGWLGNSQRSFERCVKDSKDGQPIQHYVSSKNENIIPGGPGHRLRIENGLLLIRMLRRRAGHLPLAPSRSDAHIDRKKILLQSLGIIRGQQFFFEEKKCFENMDF
ncbi:hypothetical protein K0M31_007201 [Melipona bicolor]|uniref:Uncharacterized protein n=1 Tax=Melipona bicolor TaxID=60889 RepID=A0AA40GAY3_9HYME|nr:hypothetical protein K0M31_007201 [Melipona bicolor]